MFSLFVFAANATLNTYLKLIRYRGIIRPAIFIPVPLSYYFNFYCQVVFLINFKKYLLFIFSKFDVQCARLSV